MSSNNSLNSIQLIWSTASELSTTDLARLWSFAEIVLNILQGGG